jgi:putative spermidine/putrescine transport system substrate-binding protein
MRGILFPVQEGDAGARQAGTSVVGDCNDRKTRGDIPHQTTAASVPPSRPHHLGGKKMFAVLRWPLVALGMLLVPLGVSGARAADPQTVVVASFGSLWQDALEKALAPFEAEHNVKIRFTAGSSSDNVARAIAARNHPDVDIVMGEEMTFTQGHNEKIFEKLDPAVVTNLGVVVPQAIMGDGEGVGVIMQSIGLFYRTDTIQKNGWPVPDSWFALLDKRYCHRIGLGDPNVSFTYYALMMLGGGKPDDVPAGIKLLAANRDCIDSLDPSAAKTIDKAQLGETDIGVLAHQLVVTMAQHGVPVKFVAPKEGSILQFTTAAVAKNAPNPAMAQLVVNEMLSVRAQKVLVEQFNVSPVNPAVPVSAALIAQGAPDPAHMDRYITIDAAAIMPNRRRYIQDAIRAMAQ